MEESPEPSSDHTAGGGRLLPTGCSLLNCALSGDVRGGYQSGRLVNMIGDSHAGKTVLALSGLAEMANDPAYDDYLLLYDDVELAMSFDLGRMFGRKLVNRLEEAWESETPEGETYTPPQTIQEYYSRMLIRLKQGRPFVHILDSFDALTTTEELSRADDMAKGKETGSYKMEKARWASEIFRVITRGLSETEALAIVISQTRDNIDPISFQKKTRAGGKALEFYASYIFWLAKLASITKGEKTKKIKIGRNVQAKITKSKSTGWEGDIQFPIYRQIGIDDAGSAVDFLVQWSDRWKKGTTIQCNELGLSGYRMNLCTEIDERGLLPQVREHLQEAWDAYMASADIGRKPRFSDNNGDN